MMKMAMVTPCMGMCDTQDVSWHEHEVVGFTPDVFV
jgi:hypothetical protein